ncbi:Myosin heavy chain, muscle [Portunus trituberculatus]|uniref:Myosin heavy chain, muscle n=1 Tax=Portunus trituberculatus TaxID=210409 RepID=A0A5B7DQZ0_PORTR|nr:Myosin heavy chain, muscle [Portunus trituberculatus]
MPGHVKKSTGPDPDPSEWLYISNEMKMKDATKPYDPKKSCWVPDPKEGYLEGLIQGTKGEKITVMAGGETKEYKKDQVHQVNPPKYEKCEDMSNLTYLNDPSVLYNLKARYVNKLIYTYSGLFCIVVNPYKRYPIYTNRTVKIYQNKRRNEVPPHLFAISDGAYSAMLQATCLLSNDIYDYGYVSQGKVTVPSIDDGEDMQFCHDAFDILGFTKTEIENVYKITAVVMHMGNMKFKQKGREEQAEADGKEHGAKCATLLGCDVEDMYLAITKPKIKVGTEFVAKGMNVNQCNYSIGAMAKALFDRVFKFIVSKCNETLETGLKRASFIGVLDIAGFEIFDYNGFEQICINFCNEKLQQFFNHHMFVLEQEEYKKEGINWVFVDFGMDLQACIELFEKKMGLLSILEEESMFPKATDKSFAEKLNANHLGKTPCFIKPKPPKAGQTEAHFAIVHYAGTVSYNLSGWLEKNKDPLNDTLVDVLKKSSNELAVSIFADHPGQSGGDDKKGGGRGAKSGSFKTVSSSYREQLNNLMRTLNATHPHFIRCIVPNETKSPGVVDAGLVMHQLTCNGVLEGIRICRKGFPNRIPYSDFKHRYLILAPKEMAEAKTDKNMAQACFTKAGLDEESYRLGNTKVFFRAGILGRMEELRDDRICLLLAWLQAWVRGYISRKTYSKLQKQRISLLVVQRNIRKYMKMRTWKWYGMWMVLKPTLHVVSIEDELRNLEEKAEKAEKEYEEMVKKHQELEKVNSGLTSEKNELADALNSSKDHPHFICIPFSENKQEAQKRLRNEEDARNKLQQSNKKTEQEVDSLRKDMEDLEQAIQKSEQDKATKDQQIHNMNEEVAHQEELINKINKEKKHLQECTQKTSEDLQNLEDKCNHFINIKAKLESNLDEVEDTLEREKKLRNDVEKAKRKVEGDLKLSQEAVADLERNQKEIEATILRKEKEHSALVSKIEEEQAQYTKLQRQIKEQQTRVEDLEHEAEHERQARAKAEKAKTTLAQELSELADQLDEAGGATAAQIELNKKREAELAKLRRDLEEINIQHEAALSQLRKKHNDTINEMSEQIDHHNKLKARLEKDKDTLKRDAEDAKAALDSLVHEKAAAEKTLKQIQQQIADHSGKLDEMNRTLNDFDSTKKKLSADNNDLQRQIEEAESMISQLSKMKLSLTNQLEDHRKLADEESRDRATLLGKCRNLEHDIESLREQLEIESEAKGDVQRMLSRASAEAQMWRSKYENEGVARVEEIEASRLKLAARLDEAESQIEQLNVKNVSLEKAKQRLLTDIEETQIAAERAKTIADSAEKKQKHYDRILSEWKLKVDDLSSNLDSSQKECRNYSTEVFRVKAAYEENLEQLDSIRRENKNLNDEIKDLVDQIGEGGRAYHEIEKSVKRLDIEKEELQAALEEAEAALEQEENKVLRGQLELSQMEYKDMELKVEEQHRIASEFRDQYNMAERRGNALQGELEESRSLLEQSDRARRQAESDLADANDQLNELGTQCSDMSLSKRKVEGEIQTLQTDLDEMLSEAKNSEEKAKKAMVDAARLADELRSEQEHAQNQEKMRKGLDVSLKELQARLEESEMNAQKAIKNAVAKLEGRVRELEVNLTEESRHYSDAQKNLRKCERRIKELTFQAEEDKKNHEKMQDLVDKLQQKMKTYKRQIEEAEEIAALNLANGESGAGKTENTKKVLSYFANVGATTGKKKEGEKEKPFREQYAGAERRANQINSELEESRTLLEQSDRGRRQAESNLLEANDQVSDLNAQYGALSVAKKKLEGEYQALQAEEDKKNHERMQDLVDGLQQKIKTYKRQIEEAEEIAALNLANGESGAGKTENAKKLVSYFAKNAASASENTEDSEKPSLADRIGHSNIILEAFGNAKTARNDNSSRFKFQQFYNYCNFVKVQEEYKKEGIEWTPPEVNLDLQPSIDFFEKKLGFMPIMDEESMSPKGTEKTFLEKLNANHLGKTPTFIKPKPPKPDQPEAHFAIVHYAGTVNYDLTGWLEKNKDPLNESTVDLLKTSSNELVVAIFTDPPPKPAEAETEEAKEGKEAKEAKEAKEVKEVKVKGKPLARGKGAAKGKDAGKDSAKEAEVIYKTASSGYREQLNNLIKTLNATHPRFIRCILPNETKSPVVQRNLRKYIRIHAWKWQGLLENIRPLLNITKIEDEMKVLAEKTAKALDDLEKETKLRKNLEIENMKLQEDKYDLMATLDSSKADIKEFLEKQAKLQSQKTDLEMQLEDTNKLLQKEEEGRTAVTQTKKKLEYNLHEIRQDLDDMELAMHKAQHAEAAKEQVIQGLKEEINSQEELIKKLKKEKKHLQEMNQKTAEDNQNIEDKCTHLNILKGNLETHLEKLEGFLDHEKKLRSAAEREKRKAESDLKMSQAAVSEFNRTRKELEQAIDRKNKEVSALTIKVEEDYQQITRLSKQIKDMEKRQDEQDAEILQERQGRSAAETAKVALTHEVTELSNRLSEASAYHNLEHDTGKIKEKLDEECDNGKNLQRLISKAYDEAAMWRSKYEIEGVTRVEELEASRQKLSCRLEETEGKIDQLNAKNINLEKIKQRTAAELFEIQGELHRTKALVDAAEEKQKNFDSAVEEWKVKVDNLTSELEASRKEVRKHGSETSRVNALYKETLVQVDSLRVENKGLAQEVKSLNEEVSSKTDVLHKLQLAFKRLKGEKDGLQGDLEDAEAALDQEEVKVQRGQVELNQIKQEMERRVQEKEEEFEKSRKFYMSSVDSLRVSLETEVKDKAEALYLKKKLESEVQQLQGTIQRAKEANNDLLKAKERAEKENEEQQVRLEEAEHIISQQREQVSTIERRIASLMGELEEAHTLLEQADRSRRSADVNLTDANDYIRKLTAENENLTSTKERLEEELVCMQNEFEDMIKEARGSDDKAKRVAMEAARLGEELRGEQDNAKAQEKLRKDLEVSLREMQARLDADSSNQKVGRAAFEKMEARVHDLETQLEQETIRYAESQKNFRRSERRVKELTLRTEEDQKNHESMQDLVDKLQSKIKGYKRQMEEAEEIAALNLAKYRKAQQELEEFEENASLRSKVTRMEAPSVVV